MSAATSRPQSLHASAAAKFLFRGLVMVLKRDHQPLHRAQWTERDDQDQRQPQHRMDPIGWMIERLNDQGCANYDEAGEKHDEDGRSITGIGETIIESARVAARPQLQKALKQLALPAAWTGACETGKNRSRQCTGRRLAHERVSRLRPTHRCRQTGTATRRRRSASTRRKTRSRDVASA